MFEFLKSLVGGDFQKPARLLSSVFVLASYQVATQHATTEGLKKPLIVYSIYMPGGGNGMESLVLAHAYHRMP